VNDIPDTQVPLQTRNHGSSEGSLEKSCRLMIKQTDIDNKTEFEPTQVSAVHDRERMAEDDERAHKSWIYRVWVITFVGYLKQTNVTDYLLVSDHSGLVGCILYSRHVQRNERDWWGRERRS
jgi:hypothetical protein